jgi:hypothetical protein
MRPTATGIEHALEDAGGVSAPRERAGQLRRLLARELAHGARELNLPRSGYDAPVIVAVASASGGLLAVAPAAPELRADPEAATERAWLVVAALIGALVEAAGTQGSLQAGVFDGHLALHLEGDERGAELVPLAFEDHIAGVDRLRARALAMPAAVLEDAADLRDPIGAAHPLRVAHEVARLGGRPADPESMQHHEEALLAIVDVAGAAGPGGISGSTARPHDDPDPARRVARRILQRLNGMGKWGGYHTEFSHLARGFAGNARGLAEEVGERMLAAGLLVEKPSVGQRHVYLNPRRAADVHRFIREGTAPADLELP